MRRSPESVQNKPEAIVRANASPIEQPMRAPMTRVTAVREGESDVQRRTDGERTEHDRRVRDSGHEDNAGESEPGHRRLTSAINHTT